MGMRLKRQFRIGQETLDGQEKKEVWDTLSEVNH